MPTYGSRLTQALQLAGKTRGELAAHLGITEQAVGAAARDKTVAFKAPHSAEAARFLRVDHYWLATGHGEARPGPVISPLALDIAKNFDALPLDSRQMVHALVMQAIDLAMRPRSPRELPVDRSTPERTERT